MGNKVICDMIVSGKCRTPLKWENILVIKTIYRSNDYSNVKLFNDMSWTISCISIILLCPGTATNTIYQQNVVSTY